ncbi:DEAD/DEAH box helicase [Babesia microti strain RI]|uniref:ATP-dependent RNA helicase n=1 Tax=Babesia microti (strain RI) TaxID=1133968 RepID=A0A1R4AAW8_BABMR|nr:DEAD/DEAH box helicase [Babesia microti strain RI]SJK86104.1 DEAD/DEAH box helicase [Babesia microti strain RI]|eukprot:XP_021338300.1 DEAD/DEAH box helicase [Babesia microti strain RI]
MGFDGLGLSHCILDYLNTNGFIEPTEIQKVSIPALIHDYNDVIVQAETGSGKTLCFLLPLMELYLKFDISGIPFGEKFNVFSLIIAPTRELAFQIFNTLDGICKFLDSKNESKKLLPILFRGGKSAAKERAHIDAVSKLSQMGAIISTPGKLSNLFNVITNWTFKNLHLFIIDEADRLMEMNFDVELEIILRRLPKQRKNAVYSATISSLSERLYRIGLKDWKLHSVSSNIVNSNTCYGVMDKLHSIDNLSKISSGSEKIPAGLTNYYSIVNMTDKFDYLHKFISHLLYTGANKCIMFFLTCDFVDYINMALDKLNPKFKLIKIHRKMNQRDRELAFKEFKQTTNQLTILLATDLFSRGIDVQNVDWIFQFDAPQDPSIYLHRSGRTARAGSTGYSIILLDNNEISFIEFIKSKNVDLIQWNFEDFTSGANPFGETINTSIPTLLRSIAEKDRQFMLSANKAFVSYVRAYSEHILKYTFNISVCDLGGLATLLGVLRMPRVKEILGRKFNFTPSLVNPKSVPFLCAEMEAKRLKELEENEANNSRLNSLKNEIKNVSQDKYTRKKKGNGKTKKNRTRSEKRNAKRNEMNVEWLEFSREENLVKKLKKGKISKDLFDKLTS